MHAPVSTPVPDAPQHLKWVRNLMIIFVGGLLLWAAFNLAVFIVLPPFIALLANPTVEAWTVRFNSRKLAVAAMLALIFGVLIATALLVLVPAISGAARLARSFPDLVQTYLPEAQKVVADLEARINAYHLRDMDVTLSGLIQLATKTFTEGGGAVTHVGGYLLAPLKLVGEGLIVLVLVGFNLGYWPSLKSGARSLLKLYTPAMLPWMECIMPEVQTVGRNVAIGYITVVCILTPTVFMVFLALMAVFDPQTVSVFNLLVISLCFGILSALPALGAKAGLALMVLVGMLVFGFTVQVSIVMTVIGLLITTLESKFLTPKLMGKALGLNSAVILTVALSSVLLGGIGGTLWTMFFGLVVVVAVHHVYKQQAEKQPVEVPSFIPRKAS